MTSDESAFQKEGRKLAEEGFDADVPDGEAARGAGTGVTGAGEPIAKQSEGAESDLQNDLGEDPTLVDKNPGSDKPRSES